MLRDRDDFAQDEERDDRESKNAMYYQQLLSQNGIYNEQLALDSKTRSLSLNISHLFSLLKT